MHAQLHILRILTPKSIKRCKKHCSLNKSYMAFRKNTKAGNHHGVPWIFFEMPCRMNEHRRKRKILRFPFPFHAPSLSRKNHIFNALRKLAKEKCTNAPHSL